MKQTTIKIAKRTHRRLQKHAKQVPHLTAPVLAETILTTELDRRDAALHARVAVRDEGCDDNGEPLCTESV